MNIAGKEVSDMKVKVMRAQITCLLGDVAILCVVMRPGDTERYRKKVELYKKIKSLYMELSSDEQKKMVDSYNLEDTAEFFEIIEKGNHVINR